MITETHWSPIYTGHWYTLVTDWFLCCFRFSYLEFMEIYSNEKKVFYFNLLLMHIFRSLTSKNFAQKIILGVGLEKGETLPPQDFYNAKLKIWYHPLYNKYHKSSLQLTLFVLWNHLMFIILCYVWDMLRMGQFNFTWTIPRLYISQIINFIHTYYPSSKVN